MEIIESFRTLNFKAFGTIIELKFDSFIWSTRLNDAQSLQTLKPIVRCPLTKGQ